MIANKTTIHHKSPNDVNVSNYIIGHCIAFNKNNSINKTNLIYDKSVNKRQIPCMTNRNQLQPQNDSFLRCDIHIKNVIMTVGFVIITRVY